MTQVPIRYVQPVYRPPSEADSPILPVTNGCPWNRCTFGEMNTAPQKRFRPGDEAEVQESIRRCGEIHGDFVKRVFLADGDAMTLSHLALLRCSRRSAASFRACGASRAIACRATSPRNRSRNCASWRTSGLSLVDVARSRATTRFWRASKGRDIRFSRAALEKRGEAGIKRSAMILNGLGGEALSRQHAENSAALMNATQPEFLVTLTVSFPMGEARFRENFPQWEPLGIVELMQEMEGFLSALDLKRTVFRSDNAWNWLILKGTLGADKERLLGELRTAIAAPESAPLRPAWARGL